VRKISRRRSWKATKDSLSLTVFCCAIFPSSPSSRLRRESPTLATIASQELSSLARSSACCTKASRVPILNSGILKGLTLPLSVETVDRNAVRASSGSFEGEMDVGKETSMYFVELDMVLILLGLSLLA
jgi:hypothetical protein